MRTFARRCVVLTALVAPAFASTPSFAADEPAALNGAAAPANGVWLDSLDLSAMTTGFGRASAGHSVTGNPLRVAGVTYVHGVGAHSNGEMTVDVGGQALRFLADVGVDDEVECLNGVDAPRLAADQFRVFADGKQIATSGVVKHGEKKRLDVDLRGKKIIRLVVEKQKGARFNHIDWAGAVIVMNAGAPAPRAVPAANIKEPKATADGAEAPLKPLTADELAMIRGDHAPAHGVWLDGLDLTAAQASGKNSTAKQTPNGKPLDLGGFHYAHGIGMQQETELRVDLGGGATRFLAQVGFDGGLACGRVNSGGSGHLEAWVDGRPMLSRTLHGWDGPVGLSLDLKGAKLLVLAISADGADVDWGGALVLMDAAAKAAPRILPVPPPAPAVIAKLAPDAVGLHGARIVGVSPGKPFLFMVPATGKKPFTFSATNLPDGLTLDAATGIISGTVKKAGKTSVTVTLKAANGEAKRTLAIVAAPNEIALTPPMGWNSWNVWGTDVDDAKVRAAADSLAASGLAAHGFQYVNIDDAWEGGRDAKGTIVPNKKFPDMKALAAYVHGKGLRLGIYSSPGPQTCGNFAGSYKHEAQDAATYAAWGVDYLKYDWCSYGNIVKGSELADLQKPYRIMSAALRKAPRDIVFSLCQYGMGDVWKWGKSVGGNLWRTTGDITDTWGSLSNIGFGQAGKDPFAGPGGWNDPDMLIVGKLGWSKNIRSTRLTPNEQVTHITLWSMLSAPLLLGADLTQLDPFTINLITNDEVLDVDQDAQGKQAARKLMDGPIEIWARALADGTTAVAMFNKGQVPSPGTVRWADVGVNGDVNIRDLWLRKDVGHSNASYTATVPAHGAVLLKLGTPAAGN